MTLGTKCVTNVTDSYTSFSKEFELTRGSLLNGGQLVVCCGLQPGFLPPVLNVFLIKNGNR